MAPDGNANEASFKCRRCRQFLFGSSNILSFIDLDNSDTSGSGNHGNSALNLTSKSTGHNSVDGALWYISDDATPPWIQNLIEEVKLISCNSSAHDFTKFCNIFLYLSHKEYHNSVTHHKSDFTKLRDAFNALQVPW